MKRISILMSVAFVLLLSSGRAQAQKPAYDFISIDPPGSVDTIARAINARGDIVGIFWDADGNSHGFLLSDGNYRVFDVFGSATVTSANGINARGDIVGWADTVGWLLSGGKFISLGADLGPIGINDAGDIVGVFVSQDGARHGFLLSGGKFTQIDFPDAGVCETIADSINDAGDIVGDYRIGTCDESNEGWHAFLLRTDGTFDKIDVPNSVATVPRGINAQGDVVGDYGTADGGTYGFLLRKGVFSRIEFPDAVFTRAFGINARGWIVGNWRDTSWVRHGMLAIK